MKNLSSPKNKIPLERDKKSSLKRNTISVIIAGVLGITIHSLPGSSGVFEGSCTHPKDDQKLPEGFRSSSSTCEELGTKKSLSYIRERVKRIDALMQGPENEFQKIGYSVHQFSIRDMGHFYDKNEKEKSEYLFQHLSNVDGKMSKVMVMLGEGIGQSIVDILKHKMNNAENFHFLISYTKSRDLGDLLDVFISEGLELREASKYITFLQIPTIMADQPWFRDIVFPVKTGENKQTGFVISPMLASYDSFMRDQSISAMASMVTQKKFTVGSVYLDGGNILQDKEIVFIGIDMLLRGYAIYKFGLGVSDGSMKIDQRFLHDAKRFYEEYFSKPVIVIGDLREDIEIEGLPDLVRKINLQPVYHIDVFMTPLGDKKIALAQSDNPQIKKLRAQFTQRGYIVYDIPFIGGGENGRLSVTYNNVLLEKTSTSSYVYVPQYSYGSLKTELWTSRDAEAISKWKDTKFTPIPVRISLNNLEGNGSLHCRMREIERK